jgi:hypothetical protein
MVSFVQIFQKGFYFRIMRRTLLYRFIVMYLSVLIILFQLQLFYIIVILFVLIEQGKRVV